MLKALKDDLHEIRHSLQAHLPWTTCDFIRHDLDFFDKDRQQVAQSLTEALPPEDDLRFRYQEGHLDLALLAQRLPWDSDFFGFETARLNLLHPVNTPYDYMADYSAALPPFLEYLRQRGIRYLLAPIFPEDLAGLRALGSARFELITTLNYYHISVQDYAYPQRFKARHATPEDVPALAAVARDEVNPYDRFRADPFISPEDTARMMVKWVQASVLEGFADVTLVPDVPVPKAFCTMVFHKDKWHQWGMKLSQLVFSAIDREFKGWYLKSLSEVLYHMQAAGVEHAFFSTQLSNRAAIRQSEKMGFRFGRSEHIFRLLL